MNASNALQSRPSSISRTALANESQESRQLIALGQALGRSFRVLGVAPLPTQPVRLGNWLLVPGEQDSTPIPARTMESIQAIYAQGITPLGFVMVHEAPMLLKAPVERPENPRPPAAPPASSTGAPSLDLGGLAVAVGIGMSVLGAVLFPMLFVAAAAVTVDPILVAVTQDYRWVEIDRWDTT